MKPEHYIPLNLAKIQEGVDELVRDLREARRLAEECRDNLRTFLGTRTVGPMMPDMKLPWEGEK
jgi:hypothetical protein